MLYFFVPYILINNKKTKEGKMAKLSKDDKITLVQIAVDLFIMIPNCIISILISKDFIGGIFLGIIIFIGYTRLIIYHIKFNEGFLERLGEK